MSGQRLPKTKAEWEKIAVGSNFDLVEMAESLFISARTLERNFARHLKITPRDFVRELQCCLAKELLRQGFSNKEIAAKLNFANESHFCHVFKKCYHISPKKFASS